MNYQIMGRYINSILNDNFFEQHESVLKIMNDFNFKILHKKNNFNNFETKENKHSKTYNYVFFR